VNVKKEEIVEDSLERRLIECVQKNMIFFSRRRASNICFLWEKGDW